MKKKLILFLSILTGSLMVKAQSEDPYLWLEEVDGKKALEFVDQQNKSTFDKISQQKSYQEIYNKTLDIYNSTDRIIYPNTYGNYVYNFWQDKEHVRGIWRRMTAADYVNGNTAWETLMDLDAMSKRDGEKWVYKGATGLYPKYEKFLVSLSKGGGDASITKEFDVNTKSFIDNGFSIEESKGGASYLDENTLIVSSDFGAGSMTTSGYPRQVKLWKRGTLLKDAKLIFEGDSTDVSSYGYELREGSTSYLMVGQFMTFFSGRTFVWQNGKMIKLEIPEDCQISNMLSGQLVLELKSDWTASGKLFKQGSIVSLHFESLLKGIQNVQLVYEPDEFSSVAGVSSTKNKLLLNLLTNVKSELYIYSFNNRKWDYVKVSAPDYGTISIKDVDEFTDRYYFSFENFLTPSTLFVADAGKNEFKPFKSLKSYFDGSKYKVDQFKVKSKDGTMIPYFVISGKDTKLDGKNPTLLYGYGGFEISEVPFYSGTVGNAWLEYGGVYVLSNIRGGGEFGPKWHQAGLKEKRQNIYNDFHAIAEDLISRKITSNKNLGIMGGSNGGLLMGVAFTQRPDLYNAVVCQVPLLDMKRYSKLLAGASWMGEYGDPDKPEEWDYISKYSPYQNLKQGMKYPEVFFTTSTHDDRVHPGHARKMVAKMLDMGYPVYYYENTEGGHAGSSTNEQRAKASALQYSYLLMKLKN